MTEIGTSIQTCSPYDICLYLAWKDSSGKTPVHDKNCPEIGKRSATCPCTRRLAYGTVQTKTSQLKVMLDKLGRTGPWAPTESTGNPILSEEVRVYTKQIRAEQSQGHSLRKQAIPIFASKLRLIAMMIDRHLQLPETSTKSKYVLARDQAIFKLMFFGGDRAADAGRMLSQEARTLPDGLGLIIRHTWGKTQRCDKPNVFTLFKCPDTMLCPVLGLSKYMEIASSLKIDLTTGYLFRPVTSEGLVMDSALSYESIYDRLKHYLNKLGINDGETPHSLRAGCAITMRSIATSSDLEPIKSHIGWASNSSAELYTRSTSADQAASMARAMAQVPQNPSFVEDSLLPPAFQ